MSGRTYARSSQRHTQLLTDPMGWTNLDNPQAPQSEASGPPAGPVGRALRPPRTEVRDPALVSPAIRSLLRDCTWSPS